MTAEPVPPPAPRDHHPRANPAPPQRSSGEIAHADGPRRDMSQYPQLISDGIVAAERRGTAVDHITARRISLTLLSKTSDPQLSRGLTQFDRDGTITVDLWESLHRYARRNHHPDHSYFVTLREYTAARDTEPGPLHANFGAVCDRVDRALNPSDPQSAADQKKWEGRQPRWPERRRRPGFLFVLWASDADKERNPALRANLYDLRDGKVPILPRSSAARHSLEILTPGEWDQIEAENRDDVDEAFEIHQWELDHEIE